MPYIQKSDEIYKQIRKDPDEQHPGGKPTLIPFRGLQVAGTHTEPVYMDHYLTITAFDESRPLSAVDYTTESIDLQDDTNVKFLGVVKNRHLVFTTYQRNILPDQTVDTNVKFLGVVKNRHLVFTTYGRQYPTYQKIDTHVKFLGVVKNRHLVWGIKPQSISYVKDGPTHSITITEFSSNELTIENGG